ncbi:MAG: hypothetical protein Q4E35_02800 [Eubacteriales bacterium]|nr:hypothetical protein [Eubacteriales bacterium]
MKEKLIAWMKTGKYAMHLLRAIVGGYVVYLGAQVISDVIKNGDGSFLLVSLAVLIALAGLAITGVSLWAVLGGYCADYRGNNPADDDGNAEEKTDDAS